MSVAQPGIRYRTDPVAPRTWRSARSLLAVRLDAMGDLLMTTPALRALKGSGETRTLTLLTSREGAAIAAELPFIDDVIVFTAPWMKTAQSRPLPPSATAILIERLRCRAFDAAVVFTVFTQSALPAATVLHLAGVPLRAAYCRENPYALLTDWLPDPDHDAREGVRHEVQRQIDLVGALGYRVAATRLQFPVRGDARRSMLGKVRAAGMLTERPWLIVHPGATAPSRRYPIDLFGSAVATLAQNERWQIGIAGGDADVPTTITLAESIPGAVSLAGLLTLPELAALLQAARIVVCNNSVAAHLCAAVGTPVVDLYALTNPQHTPWQVAHRVLSQDVDCKYCLKSQCPQRHHQCLAGVPPERVVAAVDSLAAETRSRGSAASPLRGIRATDGIAAQR